MRKDHRIALRGCAQSRVDGPGSASLEKGLFTLNIGTVPAPDGDGWYELGVAGYERSADNFDSQNAKGVGYINWSALAADGLPATRQKSSLGGIDRRGEDLIYCKNNCTEKMMRKDHRIALRGCAQSRVDGSRSASRRNGLFTLANPKVASNRAYNANIATFTRGGGGGHNSLRSVEFRVESVECRVLPCSALHFCFHVSAALREKKPSPEHWKVESVEWGENSRRAAEPQSVFGTGLIFQTGFTG